MDLDLATAAYHEAGHVLLAHLLGAEVRETTLESERDAHVGHTAVAWTGSGAADSRRGSALVALAGPVAEVLWRGGDVLEEDLSAWRADWAEADAVLEVLAPTGEREALRRRWLDELARILGDPETWERLCRVADALEAHGTLDRALLDELLP